MTDTATEIKMSGASAKAVARTGYVLLELSEDTGEWIVTNDGITASSATAAIKAHVAKSTSATPVGGTFVAIPERSWRPVTVTTKTTTAVVIEDAK